MATISGPATADPHGEISLTGAGFSNTTAYRVKIVLPDGSVALRDVTSDGSGGFTLKFTPPAKGSYAVEVRPLLEYTGGTTAAATATLKCRS